MKFIQITSGINGPIESSLATKFVYSTIKDFLIKLNVEIINISTYTNDNSIDNNPRSIVLEIEYDENEVTLPDFIHGTWKIIFKSPYRNTERKNWFVGVSMIKQEELKYDLLKSYNFKIDTFHCGGHGGQNVNKVETGVRVTYIPDNIVAECTDFRSQLQNRKEAIRRIQEKVTLKQAINLAYVENSLWRNHSDFERGNEVFVKELDGKELKDYIKMEVKYENNYN